MTFSRSWPNMTSLHKTTEQHSQGMMTGLLLQAISSQCQRVIHFKLDSMPLERERNIATTALAEKNVKTILLHEIIMNYFNRDLIERNWEYMYLSIDVYLREIENTVK